MPSRCCVPGCKNNYDKTKQAIGNISVFLFPKEIERRNLWLKRINRKNFVATEHSEISILCDKDGHWESLTKKVASTFANILLNNYSKVKSDVFKKRKNIDSKSKCPKKR